MMPEESKVPLLAYASPVYHRQSSTLGAHIPRTWAERGPLKWPRILSSQESEGELESVLQCLSSQDPSSLWSIWEGRGDSLSFHKKDSIVVKSFPMSIEYIWHGKNSKCMLFLQRISFLLGCFVGTSSTHPPYHVPMRVFGVTWTIRWTSLHSLLSSPQVYIAFAQKGT